MNTFKEILEQAQKSIACPICNRKFNQEEIILRGFLDDVYILQIKCDKNHHLVSLTVIISKYPIGNLKSQNHLNETETSSENNLIESDDINLGLSLESFNGDFEFLWKK